MSDQKIGPFSLQEQKLKSFSIGTMGKRSLSRKEQEDLKRKQEEDEVGKVCGLSVVTGLLINV